MNHVINSFQERFAQPDFKIYLQLQKYFLLKDIARKILIKSCKRFEMLTQVTSNMIAYKPN